MQGLKLHRFVVIALGATIAGAGINCFNIANQLAEGGVTGIAILLKYLFDYDPGAVTFIINIPLLLVGWKVLGRNTFIYTVFGTTCLSLALTLLGDFRMPLQDDLLLAALYSGVSVGVGLGAIFRVGGTTGGVDILARIFRKYLGWRIGRTMFVADLLVIVTSLIYLDIRQAMYTLVAVFVGSRVIDFVQDAAYSMRAVFVVSAKHDEVAARIMRDLHRGATFLTAEGAYTGVQKKVIYSVVGRNEVTRFKNLVLNVDREAFVSITDTHDVLGEGFTLDKNKQPFAT